MVSETFVKDKLYPLVEKALSNKANIHIIIDYISKYVDRNNAVLFSLNFSSRLVLSHTDKNIIFQTIGITEDEISNIINQSNHIANLEWTSNAFTVIMSLIIRYFSIHKMVKETDICIIYVSCFFYLLLHSKSFPYLPNKEIMEYTLNKNPNMTNSFIIKREGTIFGMIKYTGIKSHELYVHDLVKECTDIQINLYLSSIRTRIKSNMKNLSRYYYQDHKDNNYMNKDVESYEEESYNITDSTTLAISKLTSKTTTNIISYRFNKKYIANCANMDSNVYAGRLIQILDNIIEDHRKELDKFISLIIEIYILSGGNIKEISSLKFLTYSLNIYKTNSTHPKIIEIKDMLDNWIEYSSTKYGNRIIRVSTLNAYRRCIFSVFIYTISSEG